MNTSTKTQDESVLHKIAEKLVAAKQELDELAVQLSLGKIEAKDKLEEIKKEFRARLNDLKQAVRADPQKKAALELMARIVELETVLLSGKVDTKEVFDAQKRMILGAIAGIETEIKDKFEKIPAVNDFVHEIEKFKLKLEIIRLKFLVKKFKVKDAFRTGMDKAVDLVRTTGSKIRRAKARYRNFRDEVRLAYSHMKKAVKRM